MLFLLLYLLVGLSRQSAGYVLNNEERGTNLALYGLGTLRLNYADVDGSSRAFEQRETGFASPFDIGGILSLTVDGALSHNYTLDGYLSYEEDRDNNAPEWLGRFQLTRDDSYLIAGDQDDLFQETYFTRYSSQFRGLNLHLQSNTFGLTTAGALTRGALHKEEIPANETSGPYRLAEPPVVFESERVRLEVRHRNAPQRVLETRTQIRGADYRIDYEEGKITFSSPVEAETFSGNPVVIVIVYRTEADSSMFDTALMGTRATAAPGEWGSFGVTYLSQFSEAPSFAEGFDVREEIYGFDNTLNIRDAITLRSEYAVSREAAEVSDTDTGHALQLTLDGHLGGQITLRSLFRRTEREFLTFANPDIETDQQDFEAAAVYAYRPGHALELGYRLLQDDFSGDEETPVTTTHHPYLDWQATWREQTRIYARYEWMQVTDNAAPSISDTLTQDIVLGAEQGFNNVPLARILRVTGEYQLTDEQDHTDTDTDTRIHQLGLRLRAEPDSQLALILEQRESLVYDRDLGEQSERRDLSKIGLEFFYGDTLSAQTAYSYEAEHDLLTEQQTSAGHTVTAQADFQPAKRFSGTAKIEFREETSRDTKNSLEGMSDEHSTTSLSDEWTTHSLLLEGGLRVILREGLLLRAHYLCDLTREEAETSLETRDDHYEVALNYTFDPRHRTQINAAIRVEPDELDAPPAPSSEFTTVTYLVSGMRQLSARWNAQAEYRHETEDDDLKYMCDDASGEIGFRTGQFITVAGGYHYSTCEDDLYTEENYAAHSAYIKLIGKL